jgi:hypothetical protein
MISTCSRKIGLAAIIESAPRLTLLTYMNKTVRFFGRIVAYPVQPASAFLDNENVLTSY